MRKQRNDLNASVQPSDETDTSEELQVVIIGGGPGGIVALKEIVASGVTRVALLEREECIGGLFARGYDSLRLTSSAPFSMFSDFPIPEGHKNHFWTKSEVISYGSIRISYAHGLTGRIPTAAARTARGVGCLGSTAR